MKESLKIKGWAIKILYNYLTTSE